MNVTATGITSLSPETCQTLCSQGLGGVNLKWRKKEFFMKMEIVKWLSWEIYINLGDNSKNGGWKMVTAN